MRPEVTGTMNKTVYFDNNATTQVAPEVREAMMPFFGDLYGNPSSMHAFGGQVAKYVAQAREQVAAFFNCTPDEVFFTSCATESDNTAIRGTADWFGKDMKMVTTAVEHPAVLQPSRRLKALGHTVVELPVNHVGQFDLDQLRAELKDTKNALVSVMWANNETGTIFPVREAAEIAKEFGATFHTDAVQVAGKVPIDMQQVFPFPVRKTVICRSGDHFKALLLKQRNSPAHMRCRGDQNYFVQPEAFENFGVFFRLFGSVQGPVLNQNILLRNAEHDQQLSHFRCRRRYAVLRPDLSGKPADVASSGEDFLRCTVPIKLYGIDHPVTGSVHLNDPAGIRPGDRTASEDHNGIGFFCSVIRRICLFQLTDQVSAGKLVSAYQDEQKDQQHHPIL